jgi:hypothetical protein
MTEAAGLRTRDQHLSLLKKCVAMSFDGLIIRKRTNGTLSYTSIRSSEIPKKFAMTVQVTEDNRQCRLCNWLLDMKLRQRFAYFDNMAVFSQDNRVLSKFIPLPPPPDMSGAFAWAKRVVEFFLSRVANPQALQEEFSTHAYRIRHPSEFCSKIFCHYSPTGNTGKSLLVAILGKMYPNFSNVGVKATQVGEARFQGWVSDLLYLNLEELESDNYRSHAFEIWVKQASTANSSGECKYQDVRADRNWAILSFNTNQGDLYGLIRSDEALLSRLVVVEFKERGDLDWTAAKKELGIEGDLAPLAAALFYYLATDGPEGYQIVSNFSPDRYYSAEKDALLDRLRNTASTPLDTWFAELGLIQKDDFDIATDSRVLRVRKWKDVSYVYANRSDVSRSFTKFAQSQPNRIGFKLNSAYRLLESKGFRLVKTNGSFIYRITEDEFNKMRHAASEVEDVGEGEEGAPP